MYTSFHSAHVHIQAYKIDGGLVCCTAVPENLLRASVCIYSPVAILHQVQGSRAGQQHWIHVGPVILELHVHSVDSTATNMVVLAFQPVNFWLDQSVWCMCFHMLSSCTSMLSVMLKTCFLNYLSPIPLFCQPWHYLLIPVGVPSYCNSAVRDAACQCDGLS